MLSLKIKDMLNRNEKETVSEDVKINTRELTEFEREISNKIENINFINKNYAIYINNKYYDKFQTMEEVNKRLKLIGYKQLGELYWKKNNSTAIVRYIGNINGFKK